MSKAQRQAPSAWRDIEELALSIDGYKEAGKALADVANGLGAAWKSEGTKAVEAASTEHLRWALFFEQRRWRHFGEVPDARTMEYLRAIVAELERRNGVDWLWDQANRFRPKLGG